MARVGVGQKTEFSWGTVTEMWEKLSRRTQEDIHKCHSVSDALSCCCECVIVCEIIELIWFEGIDAEHEGVVCAKIDV